MHKQQEKTSLASLSGYGRSTATHCPGAHMQQSSRGSEPLHCSPLQLYLDARHPRPSPLTSPKFLCTTLGSTGARLERLPRIQHRRNAQCPRCSHARRAATWPKPSPPPVALATQEDLTRPSVTRRKRKRKVDAMRSPRCTSDQWHGPRWPFQSFKAGKRSTKFEQI